MNGSMKSIMEMCRGGVIERIDYEMVKVMDNILDANTAAKAKRKLTVTVVLTPSEDGQNITVDYLVKSSLAPTKPLRTMLYVSDRSTVTEMTPQVPGQVDLNGEIQEGPAQLRLIKFA